VGDQVVEGWRSAEMEKRIAEKAGALFERLKGGALLATLAGEIGREVTMLEHVKRGEPPEGLTQNATAQAFAGPEGHVANAEGTGSSRILLHVDSVIVPSFFPEAAGVDGIEEQLMESLRDEIVATFNLELLDGRKTSINNNAFQQVSGQVQAQ
jgi:peptidyl-prolyl cis-trans isomerase D